MCDSGSWAFEWLCFLLSVLLSMFCRGIEDDQVAARSREAISLLVGESFSVVGLNGGDGSTWLEALELLN